MKIENVVVILVAYRNRQYIDGCIGSLLRQKLSEENIIVVDNASPYGEAEYIEKKWKKIHVIRMRANAGFSKANNEGIKFALSLGADYCLLLNLDTVVCDGMLEKLISSIPDGNNGISTPRIYTTQSKIYNCFDSKESIPWYTGGIIDRETFIINQHLYEYEDTTIRNVEFASGCCMLIPKEVILKVGFLDEEYFLYYEDVDYCLHLQKLGFEICYNPNALLWHAEGGSQRQEKKAADYYLTRNRLLCIQKYMDMLQADPYELMKAMIRNEDFFIGYGSRRIISYEKKAIEDFIGGVTGQIAGQVYYFDDAFEKETREDGRGAAWSTNVSGSILLCNFTDTEKYLSLEFGIDTEDPKDTSTYTLYLDEKVYRRKCSSHMGYGFVIPFNRMEQHRLTVVKDRNRYVIRESDKAALFFRLNNFRLQEYDFVLESGAAKIEKIGVTECDRQQRWNWIQAERAKITFSNPFCMQKKYRISFSTYSPSDQKRIAFSINNEGFEEEVGKKFIYELSVGAGEQVDLCFYDLIQRTDDKILSLIDIRWEPIEGFSKGIDSTLIHTSPYIRGFGEPEQQENKYWNWIVKPQAKVVIRNVDHIDKVVRVSFCTFSACNHKSYVLSVNGRQKDCIVGEEMVLDYGLPSDGEIILLFDDMGKPVISDNGEELYLSMINFNIEELTAVQYQKEECGRIIMANRPYRSQRYRISFNTANIKDRLGLRLLDREESFVIEPDSSFAYEVMLEKNEGMEVVFDIEDCADTEALMEQIDFLIAELDAFETSADCQLAKLSGYIQGFSEQERDGNSYWNWIVKPQARVVIHNVDHFDKVIRVSFCTFSACNHHSYTLSVNGKQQDRTIGEELVLDYRLPSDGEIVLLFKDMGNPVISDNGEELYLSVINFNIKELVKAQYRIEECGKLVLANQSDKSQCYRISFDTANIKDGLNFRLPGREEKFFIEPRKSFFYEVMLEKNESMEAEFATENCADIGVLVERINFLIAEIDAFEESADCQLAKASDYIQGFGEQERDENSYWNWIIEEDARIILHNTSDLGKCVHISFNTFSVCDRRHYLFSVNGRSQECTVGKTMTLEYKLPTGGECILCFRDLGEPFETEDGRKLYLSILNFKAVMSEV